ncbi:kelch motif family protein, putative [Ichthyophthirius multifiliis]|uniref:Kelch motif family protein, putative n=1 Tax=Ichthyophthirius multifiliis TaxID=5932 RepID=G0R1Y8_ICHMU|nr:kelch motif family protein, putative [Ichthyophthirius multifiliis]EGR28513.1 kelch motif family protein, putative [Ichthyophthirius multifiliis]|eukprot:XP_004029749.1 kelch motif family protein, putative [Ichthyophthirius multifiliis]
MLLRLDVEHPIQFEIIQTQGKMPEGRFSHSMDLVVGLNSLVIYGGIGQNYKFLDDFWIFQLHLWEWMKVNCKHQHENLNLNKFEHSSCVFGSQIFIFGGISNQNYCDCFLYSVESDSCENQKQNKADDYGEKSVRNVDKSIGKVNNNQKKNFRIKRFSNHI